jgi:uncharacterized repeat protein (TIGR04138 family)
MTSETSNPIFKLLKEDRRYHLEAYQFVREALSYAQDVMVKEKTEDSSPERQDQKSPAAREDRPEGERHLSGQQLCEAIRRYALEQYGFMTRVVLKSWGVTSTSDFGEIVYNLIGIGFMKKSTTDRREDFNGVYDFDDAFQQNYQITMPD